MAMFTSPNFQDADPGIIFKFNYTANRELFEVAPMRGGAQTFTYTDYDTEATSYLDSSTCENGDYYHNNEEGANRLFSVCASGKNRTMY